MIYFNDSNNHMRTGSRFSCFFRFKHHYR